MKTKSGRDIGVFFPTALLEAFVAFSKSSDKAINWHIRQACIEYLSRHGIDVSDLSNPEGRGARSDLKKPFPKTAFDIAIEESAASSARRKAADSRIRKEGKKASS